jgi:hypothetical protein
LNQEVLFCLERIAGLSVPDDEDRRACLQASEQGLMAVWDNPEAMSTMSCSRNNVVLLRIPFSDLSSAKVRPAVIVETAPKQGDLFLVPITSRVRQGAIPLKGWESCGLNVPRSLSALRNRRFQISGYDFFEVRCHDRVGLFFYGIELLEFRVWR